MYILIFFAVYFLIGLVAANCYVFTPPAHRNVAVLFVIRKFVRIGYLFIFIYLLSVLPRRIFDTANATSTRIFWCVLYGMIVFSGLLVIWIQYGPRPPAAQGAATGTALQQQQARQLLSQHLSKRVQRHELMMLISNRNDQYRRAELAKLLEEAMQHPERREWAMQMDRDLGLVDDAGEGETEEN